MAASKTAQSLKDVLEYKEMKTSQGKKFSSRVSNLVLSILIFSTLYFSLGFAISNSFIRDLKYDKLIKIFIFGVKSALILFAYNIFSNLIMIARTTIKGAYPDKLFAYSFLLTFTENLSILLALLVGCMLKSCSDILASSKTNSSGSSPFEVVHLFKLFNTLIEDSKELIRDEFDLNIIFGLIGGVMIIFLGDIIIFGLNFNVHYRYFEERINKNKERLAMLERINRIVGVDFTTDCESISKLIILKVSKDGNEATYDDLIEAFGEENTAMIFEACILDLEGDESPEPIKVLRQENISSMYINTIMEQTHIFESVDHNNKTVDGFKRILDIFFKPLGITIALKIAGFMWFEKIFDVTFIGALIFSTGYSFSDIIREFLKNLSFIFFSRPYEINDIIIVDSVCYKVASIELLTTILVSDSKMVLIPNSVLSQKEITNLRRQKTWKEKYTYTFQLDSFKDKKEIVLKELKTYVSEHSKIYRNSPHYSEIKVLEDNKVSVCISIGFNLDLLDMNVIRVRKNHFVFVLNDVLERNDLKLVK